MIITNNESVARLQRDLDDGIASLNVNKIELSEIDLKAMVQINHMAEYDKYFMEYMHTCLEIYLLNMTRGTFDKVLDSFKELL
jgi:hypothetical protein